MEASAREYANGPAGYPSHSTGFICEDTIILQRGVRDLNDDSAQSYMDAYIILPAQRTVPTPSDATAIESAEILMLAQNIAEEIGDSAEVHSAAAKLQAIQRAKLARKETERLREEKRIAADIGDSAEVHKAATKLQAVQRGRKAKQEVSVLRAVRLECNTCKTHRVISTGPSIGMQKAVKTEISSSCKRTLILRNNKDQPIVELLHRNKHSYSLSERLNNLEENLDNAYDFHLDASALHGRVLGDSWFAQGGPAFSPDERYAVYIACDKKYCSGADSGNGSNGVGNGGPSYFDSKEEKERPSKKGTKFEYNDDWGERYADVHATVLCILDCDSGEIHVVPLPDAEATKGLTVGQPSWVPHDGAPEVRYILSYTHWSNSRTVQDTKLGMIYCYNRPCSICTVDVTAWLTARTASANSVGAIPKNLVLNPWEQPVVRNITNSTLCIARSPRWCPEWDAASERATLVCVGRTHKNPMFTHGGSVQMFRIDVPHDALFAPTINRSDELQQQSESATITDISIHTVVDLIPLPQKTVTMPPLPASTDAQASVSDSSFPGLYIDQLPRNPFARTFGNWSVLCTSTWGSRQSIISIALSTGKVRRLSSLMTAALPERNDGWNDSHHASCSVLDVCTDSDVETGRTLVLFETSSPCTPQRVGLLLLDADAPEHSTRLDLPRAPRSQLNYGVKGRATDTLPGMLQEMKWRIFTHNPADYSGNADTGNGSNKITFESILILPPTQALQVKQITEVSRVSASSAMTPVKTTAVTVVAATAIASVDGPVGFTGLVQAEEATLLDASPARSEAKTIAPTAPSTPRPSSGTPRKGKHTLEHESTDTPTTPAVPLILVPHGGPHGTTPTSWMPAYAYLSLSLGAAILHVNYRGSLGFGQASVDALPGHIGKLDTNDMMQAMEEVISAVNGAAAEELGMRIDRRKLLVVGGSHGGFLVGHLTGQFPNTFISAAMRNPVTNIPSMATITDIPDWCHIEVKGLGGLACAPLAATGTSTAESIHHNIWTTQGGAEQHASTYDFVRYASNVLSDNDLRVMRASSPIAYVDKVVTPTLVVIGSKDRRVPSTQGMEWYRTLRSQGVESKMLVFPEDCHAIDLPCSEAEHFVAIRQWFAKDIAAVGSDSGGNASV